MQKFDNIKMQRGETLNYFDERFKGVINDLAAQEKEQQPRGCCESNERPVQIMECKNDGHERVQRSKQDRAARFICRPKGLRV